jgi:alpha-1,3-rhamnosyltransferase
MSQTTHTPQVTVVIASYNHARYVRDSISSAIRQTYKNLDILIIDDGSTDDSVDTIRNYIAGLTNPARKITFIYRDNRGLCNTLNQAIEIANGDYLVTLASDDILLPRSVSLMIAAATKDTSIAGVAGSLIEVDSNNKYVPVLFNRLLSRNLAAKFISFSERFSLAEPFPATGSLFEKLALIDVGGFSADTWVEDYYIHLKLLEAGYSLYRVKDFVALYRMHDSNSILATKMLSAEVDKIRSLFSARLDFSELMSKSLLSKQCKAANRFTENAGRPYFTNFLQICKNSIKKSVRRTYRGE